MTDLKSTKKKHFDGTQLKLREYQRFRNSDATLTKKNEEISSERQEPKIKQVKHLAIKVQTY